MLYEVITDGAISIIATTASSAKPSVKASSAVQNETTSEDSAQAVAGFGGSVAIAVGFYDDDADAYISGNAEVDAIVITSYSIHYTKLYESAVTGMISSIPVEDQIFSLAETGTTP